jgi:hypothetical protein
VTGNPRDSHLERISKFVAAIVEGRDPDLGGHHQRLGESAVLFAQHIGCSSEETELLSVGARIHDIGKLSISEHILNKPARLTAAEFSLVKQHTEIGNQLLGPLGLASRISEVVHYHHENYDGSGYPRGLAGEAISLLARMDQYELRRLAAPFFHHRMSGGADRSQCRCGAENGPASSLVPHSSDRQRAEGDGLPLFKPVNDERFRHLIQRNQQYCCQHKCSRLHLEPECRLAVIIACGTSLSRCHPVDLPRWLWCA